MLTNEVSYLIAIFSWVAFGVGFLILKRRQPRKYQKRDKLAMIGLLLEGIAFAFVFSMIRDISTNIFPMRFFIQIIMTILSGVLAIASVWLALSAVKTLGKQWDFKAQIIEGHELVTTGPYKIVRHPIYSALFGLLIVTGYSMTQLWAFITAIVLFFIGTIFRIKVEERLLIQYFGDQYVKYKTNVRALIPFLF